MIEDSGTGSASFRAEHGFEIWVLGVKGKKHGKRRGEDNQTPSDTRSSSYHLKIEK